MAAFAVAQCVYAMARLGVTARVASTTRRPVVQWSVAKRAQALAAVSPFDSWPAETVGRLADSASIAQHPRGSQLKAFGQSIDHLFLLLEGSWEAGVTTPTGHRTVLRVDVPGRLYGLMSVVDGLPIPNDLVAMEALKVLLLPFQQVRAELERDPGLWKSIAEESVARSRAHTPMMYRLLFDSVRARAAGLLVGLADAVGRETGVGISLGISLPRERFAQLLGVSRQTATVIVGELVQNRIAEWRYGRVTLLDLPRLRAAAQLGLAASTTAPSGRKVTGTPRSSGSAVK
jgi:CRP-like cAMP-binding protein